MLRRAHAVGVPVLGICCGGQALAAALGGAVEPVGEPEIGLVTLETRHPGLIEAGPWFQWHGDRWRLPAGVHALARTAVAEQAFVAGRSLGLQFHPEITSAMLEGWLGNGGQAHLAAIGLHGEELLAQPRRLASASAARARALVHRFVTQVATNSP